MEIVKPILDTQIFERTQTCSCSLHRRWNPKGYLSKKGKNWESRDRLPVAATKWGGEGCCVQWQDCCICPLLVPSQSGDIWILVEAVDGHNRLDLLLQSAQISFLHLNLGPELSWHFQRTLDLVVLQEQLHQAFSIVLHLRQGLGQGIDRSSIPDEESSLFDWDPSLNEPDFQLIVQSIFPQATNVNLAAWHLSQRRGSEMVCSGQVSCQSLLNGKEFPAFKRLMPYSEI